MRLKLDENLGRTAAALFQSVGHDTETVRGEGLCRASDREVIAGKLWVVQRGRIREYQEEEPA